MDNRSRLTEEIIKKARSLGASVSGIASVASLKISPSHKIYPKIGLNLNERFTGLKADIRNPGVLWPEDALSAVVIGVEHNPRRPELDWWDGKGTSGNRILMKINKDLASWIEETFHIKTFKLPYSIEQCGIFLKDAAVNAGLGCIGKNNLVITPEYGPRIRFRALLISREARPTESAGFNPCRGCAEPCRKACPINAFDERVYLPGILGQSALPGINGAYDRFTCNLKMERDIDDAAAMMERNDEKQQEIRNLIYESEKSHIKRPKSDERIRYCVRYCRECELSCPVGSA